MRFFNSILGFMSIFGAGYCMLYPDIHPYISCWIFGIVVLAWGLCSFFAYFTRDKSKIADVLVICRGIVATTAGAIALFFLIVSNFYENIFNMLQSIILVISIIWLVIDGILCMNSYVQFKQYSHTKGTSILYLIIFIAEIITALAIFTGYQFDESILNIYTSIAIAVFGVRLILTAFAADRTAIID
ncbi:MAG: DUF308 domain-containing protein [Coriobacteriia bacterium]|nr:DUF308 domain-containing protein [Coriobacteriia bacterium]